MYKVRGCIAPDNSAKKTYLLHGCNLALLSLLLSRSLLTGAAAIQQPAEGPVKRIEILSYEGEKVSAVDLAGQPGLNADDFMPLVAQHGNEPLSVKKVDETIAALQHTGEFRDVQLDLRPEQDGVRILFILQPAVYFGIYQFPGAEQFPYTHLLQASGYLAQEPYSAGNIKKGQESITTFLRRNGYFESEVHPEVQLDKASGLANVNFRVRLNRLAKFGEIVINAPAQDQFNHLKDVLHSTRARLKGSAIREGQSYSLKTLEKATQYL